MEEKLILLAKEFLRTIDRDKYIDNEHLTEISFRHKVLTVNWNYNNYNFFIRSDGFWSWEDRDFYQTGRIEPMISKSWITYLEERNWSKQDAFDAVNSWIYTIKKMKYCNISNFFSEE